MTRVRWRHCLAQLGVGTAAGLLWLVLGVWLPGFLLVLLLVCGAGAVAGVLWLEGHKTRVIARDALARSGVEQLAGEGHEVTIRRLTQSRRTIVEAFEIERARVERDLHDGAQQYLLAASLKVGEAALALNGPADAPTTGPPGSPAALLEAAQDDIDTALAALRETVAGVHSRLLAERGLQAALPELVERLSPGREVTLRIPHPLPTLPAGVASAAWFFTSEALTNAVKHAPQAPISIVVAAQRALQVTVVDAGPGGARLVPGHGLAGMRERLRAFGGELELTSPPGGPTTVAARIPLLLQPGESGLGEEDR